MDKKEGGAELVYGRHAVKEALLAGRSLYKILVARGLGGAFFHELRSLAASRSVPVQIVPAEALDRLTARGVHQGCVALVSPYNYASLDEILATHPSCLLVLAYITDPRNLGAILRTAAAVGVEGVIIPSRRAAGLTAEALKASAGGAEHVKVARVTNLAQTLRYLKEQGFWVLGAEADAKVSLWEAEWNEPLVVVIGGEDTGLGKVVRRECDVLVRIPTTAKMPCLNASVAAAVILYEVLRRQMKGKNAGDNLD
ncbi:RNA methyltransferase, TrmH family, group 3 [Ammonifex degensii KC4]|uniref:RNA methyltransferase, TrmH family, group 3 n=1 Tax=Ammonifex degensii (strain DSM 10501 / KC4) TaxID=429009 RepID=C9RBD1_AMMDK|nr:23S rRNA (guanosine(2251)-2'-O)-methyltransferase RlmB [Ammonifex degensii]ACX51558.1 RNA methyltransferase, TrmH family, group 3 [Ammonifex degensii KC4]